MKLLITLLLSLLLLTGCSVGNMTAVLSGLSDAVQQSNYGSNSYNTNNNYRPRTCSTLNGLTHCW